MSHKGKKTYILSALIVAYAVGGWLLGEIPPAEAGRLVLEGGVFATLRAGVAKLQSG